jgi:hypothetical protein
MISVFYVISSVLGVILMLFGNEMEDRYASALSVFLVFYMYI